MADKVIGFGPFLGPVMIFRVGPKMVPPKVSSGIFLVGLFLASYFIQERYGNISKSWRTHRPNQYIIKTKKRRLSFLKMESAFIGKK